MLEISEPSERSSASRTSSSLASRAVNRFLLEIREVGLSG